jgi:hypothetical protein
MKIDEIKSRTKEIQKMMGYKLVNLSEYENYVFMDNNEERIIYSGGYTDYLTKDSLIPFLDSWYWLMLVVDFIEKLNMQVSIIDNECAIINKKLTKKQKENPFFIEPIVMGESENKKLSTFIAISDFAKLYNENKIIINEIN